MFWQLLLSTFASVFVAELGDKTQLATLSMASGSTSKWPVFFGSALALVTTSAIAVLAGGAVSRYVSPVWLRRIAGGVFIVLGALFLLTRGE
jgi:putative Ca2+/H+ antiporter (TMEM165/GDT1 family)